MIVQITFITASESTPVRTDRTVICGNIMLTLDWVLTLHKRTNDFVRIGPAYISLVMCLSKVSLRCSRKSKSDMNFH